MSAWYPESRMMKEVVVNYERQENGCDLLEPRYNGGVIGFDKESVNSVGGTNV